MNCYGYCYECGTTKPQGSHLQNESVSPNRNCNNDQIYIFYNAFWEKLDFLHAKLRCLEMNSIFFGYFTHFLLQKKTFLSRNFGSFTNKILQKMRNIAILRQYVFLEMKTPLYQNAKNTLVPHFICKDFVKKSLNHRCVVPLIWKALHTYDPHQLIAIRREREGIWWDIGWLGCYDTCPWQEPP